MSATAVGDKGWCLYSALLVDSEERSGLVSSISTGDKALSREGR